MQPTRWHMSSPVGVLIVLLGTMGYAIAEDLILTTYYPSPRGVYDELRVNTLTLMATPGNLQVPGSLAVGPTLSPGNPGELLVENNITMTPDHGLYFGVAGSDGLAFINNGGSLELILATAGRAHFTLNQIGEAGLGMPPVAGAKLAIGGGQLQLQGNDLVIQGGDLIVDKGRGLRDTSGTWSLRPFVGRSALGAPQDGLAFYTGSSGSTQPRMVITDTGNVSIGTTNASLGVVSGGYLTVRDVWLRDAFKWASERAVIKYYDSGQVNGQWATATCGQGEVLVGGGCEFHSAGTEAKYNGPVPTTGGQPWTTWQCVHYGAPYQGQFWARAFAICQTYWTPPHGP